MTAGETARFVCKARAYAMDPPADCDWPHCGCDPHADKVLDALIEEGWRPPASTQTHNQPCGHPFQDTDGDGLCDYRTDFRAAENRCLAGAAEHLSRELRVLLPDDWTRP